MSAKLLPQAKQQYFDAAGNLLSFGKVYTYLAGTTTNKATWSDAAQTSPNTNPIILDARGEADIFWSGNYKIAVETSVGAPVWTRDNINTADTETLATLATSGGAALIGFIQAGTGAVARTAQAKMREHVTAEDFGVVAGEADSKAKLHTGLIALRAAGGGNFKLVPGQTYNVSSSGATNMGGTVDVLAGIGHLLLPPVDNVHFDGNGGYLRSTVSTQAVVAAIAEFERTDEVTGAMAVGAATWTFLTAGVAANYAVGNNVFWRLEDNPTDAPEPLNWGHAKVVSVNTGANQITLDRVLHRAWDGTDTNNKHIYKLQTSRGQVIDNVRVSGTSVNGVAENIGARIQGLVNPRIPNLSVSGAKIGAYVQFCEGARFGRVVLEKAPYTGLNTGQGIRFAESSAHIESLHTNGIESNALLAESACDVTVGYHEDICLNPTASRLITFVGTNSRVHIDRALYKGKGDCVAFDASLTGAQMSYGHVRYEKDMHEKKYPLPGRDCQELSLEIAGVKELYKASQKINLTPLLEAGNGYQLEYFRPGVVSRLVVYFGGGLVAADITTLNIMYNSGTNSILAITPPAAPTQDPVDLTAMLGFGTTAMNAAAFAQRATNFNVQVTWASDLRGTGKFLLFDIDIIPDALDTSYLFGDKNSLRMSHGPDILYGQKTYDAPSIAAGAQTSTTVTVTGAKVGDFVTAVAFGVSTAGLNVSQQVTAADTVTVFLDNNTAAAIDLASTTLSVKVETR